MYANSIYSVRETEANRGGGIVLGDTAYPTLNWLIPPYDNPVTDLRQRLAQCLRASYW